MVKFGGAVAHPRISYVSTHSSYTDSTFQNLNKYEHNVAVCVLLPPSLGPIMVQPIPQPDVVPIANLIHPLAAVGRAAHARDLVRLVLQIELVVVRQLLALVDLALGHNDDAAVLVHVHDLRATVRVARVIDVARQAARQRRVHHPVLVQPEHVDAAILNTKQDT